MNHREQGEFGDGVTVIGDFTINNAADPVIFSGSRLIIKVDQWPVLDQRYSDEVIRSGGYFAAYEHCVFDRCVIFGAERLSFRECFMEDVVLVGEPASFRDNFLYDVRVTTLDAHYADFKQRLARAIGASS